jgi:hypothetical protein
MALTVRWNQDRMLARGAGPVPHHGWVTRGQALSFDPTFPTDALLTITATVPLLIYRFVELPADLSPAICGVL